MCTDERREGLAAMTTQDTGFYLDLTRRKLLAAAGIAGGAAVAASLVGTEAAPATPASRPSPDPMTTPPVAGLHLQFGADASSEMLVSWHTPQSISNPVSCSGISMVSSSASPRRKRPVTPTQSPARLSTCIMRKLVNCGATPLIF